MNEGPARSVGGAEIVSRSRMVRSWSAAIFFWLISIPLCLGLANDLVAAPAPGLQSWKAFAVLLPALSILVALIAASAVALRTRSSSVVVMAAAQALLWCSAVVVLLAIPKAP